MAATVRTLGIKDVTTLALGLPYVDSLVEADHSEDGFVYGVPSSPYNQDKVTLCTMETIGRCHDVSKIPVEGGFFTPSLEKDQHQVYEWKRLGGKGVLGILTKAFGPSSVAVACDMTTYNSANLDSGVTVQKFTQLEDYARQAATYVNRLYTELVRLRLTEEYAEGMDVEAPKPPLKHVTSLCGSIAGFDLEDVESKDVLHVSSRSGQSFQLFSLAKLVSDLSGTAFDFESRGQGWLFAREVKSVLCEEASILDGSDVSFVTTQQIWDATVKVACKMKREPKEPDLFEDDVDAERYQTPLSRCQRVEDYPLRLLVDFVCREALKEGEA
ncbi:MAG: hypothetical protein S4CHLAM37_00650 [Chlamydiia bacterium]|nr:hypothetical protein [Chlamydiia bacterium]